MKFSKLNVRTISEEQLDYVEWNFPKRYWKAINYRLEIDFLKCIGAYILLIDAFKGLKEKDIKFTSYGKPYLEGEYAFSYSCSGDYAVLVTDENEIGIKMEKIVEKDTNEIDKIFTPNEVSYISEKNTNERYFEILCKKEALLKLFGFEIETPINEIDVLELNEKNPCDVLDNNVYCKVIKDNGYMIAICSISKPIFD